MVPVRVGAGVGEDSRGGGPQRGPARACARHGPGARGDGLGREGEVGRRPREKKKAGRAGLRQGKKRRSARLGFRV